MTTRAICPTFAKPSQTPCRSGAISPTIVPMELSLTEAATQLGKTPRQVRYLIKQGRLRARKHGTSWLIDSADLPKSEARPSS